MTTRTSDPDNTCIVTKAVRKRNQKGFCWIFFGRIIFCNSFRAEVNERFEPSESELTMLADANDMLMLPIHVPHSFDEIQCEVDKMAKMLLAGNAKSNPPKMITIARSCADGFLPMRWSIQTEKAVMEALQSIYGADLDVRYADEI